MVTILHPVNINPNWDNLRREIQATYPGATITDYPRLAPQISEIVVTHDAVTAQGLEAILTAHNPATLTTEQAEVAQADSAKTVLKTLMSGLHELSAEDKSYAIACRIMAAKDGATQQTIMAIVDRPTAVAYITSKPEWANATVATRNLVGDVLEMVAGITQVLLLVL